MGFRKNLDRYTAKSKGIYDPYKELFQLFIIPLVLSFIPIVWPTKAGACAFVVMLMSVYWIAQCVPIAVTSLLPVVFYPLMGILSSDQVSRLYFNDNIMFIFGSLMIGIGIETSGLHQKLALRVVMFVGSQPRWLLLGVMSITGFLSIWISNTAVAAMMLPIVVSLVKNIAKLDPIFQEPKQMESPANIYITVRTVQELIQHNREITAENEREENVNRAPSELEEIKTDIEDITPEDELDDDAKKKDVFQSKAAKYLIKGFLLSITYASLIGGSASLIGTTSNLYLKTYFETNKTNSNMNFITFIGYALPWSIIQLLVVWLILGFWYLPKEKFFDLKKMFKRGKKDDEDTPKGPDLLMDLVKTKYEELGPYTWEQISIGSWFLVAVLLWLTRDLHFVPGWQHGFEQGYITDTTTAILVLFCTMVWPKKNIFRGEKYTPLMVWADVERMFPWSVIILLGGSLAMASGCDASGFSDWLAKILEDILPSDQYLMLLIMMIASSIGTELMSNISMMSILLPILDRMATDKGISDYFLLLPQSIAINLSYMFPSATPANALVFGIGYVTLKDMALTGLTIKLVGLVLGFAVSSVWLPVVFPFTSDITTTTITTTTIANGTFEYLATTLS